MLIVERHLFDTKVVKCSETFNFMLVIIESSFYSKVKILYMDRSRYAFAMNIEYLY